MPKYLGVGPQVSGRLCEAKPEAKNPIYIGWGEEMYQYDKNGSKRYFIYYEN